MENVKKNMETEDKDILKELMRELSDAMKRQVDFVCKRVNGSVPLLDLYMKGMRERNGSHGICGGFYHYKFNDGHERKVPVWVIVQHKIESMINNDSLPVSRGKATEIVMDSFEIEPENVHKYVVENMSFNDLLLYSRIVKSAPSPDYSGEFKSHEWEIA